MGNNPTGRIIDDPRMPGVGYLVAGRYQIVEVLGEGGFAAVFLARDVRAGGQLALKILDPVQSDDRSAVDRFRQEVAVVRELSHHNTVKIWDVGTTDTGCVFYAMELVRGEELSDLVAREGALPTERALRILTQVLASLAEAHQRGIVHRDLKPKNIMVSQSSVERDYVKVLDFGIAKSLAPELSMAKTQTGMLLCTPAYAAPELLRGTGISPATDLYAVGLILVELLTGRPAVQGGSVADLIAQQIMPAAVALPPELANHPLRPVIDKATAKDLGVRYQRAESMLDDLRRFANGPGVAPAGPKTAPAGGSRRTLMLGLALIAVALIALSVLVVLLSQRNGEPSPNATATSTEGSGSGQPARAAATPTGEVATAPDMGPATSPPTTPEVTPTTNDPPHTLQNVATPPSTSTGTRLPGTYPALPAGLVRLRSGRFQMGSPTNEPFHQADETLRNVTLTRDFYVGIHEVTQGEFMALIGRNPSAFPDCGPECPVDSVSWYEAIAYANRRSIAEGLEPCYLFTEQGGTLGGGCQVYSGYGGWACDSDYILSGLSFQGLDCEGYRLPTEAEWEYAARAGTRSATYAGEPTRLQGGPDPMAVSISWYMENSGNRPRPVGRLAPNGWGLYDMFGNIWEWTNDWYAPYPFGAVVDPTGPAWGRTPVIRGSGFNGTLRTVRAANRFDDVEGSPPSYRGKDTGFRLVRTAGVDQP